MTALGLRPYLLNLSVGTASRPFAFDDSLYLVKVRERAEPSTIQVDQVQDIIRAELESREPERLDCELAARRKLQISHVISQMAYRRHDIPPAAG